MRHLVNTLLLSAGVLACLATKPVTAATAAIAAGDRPPTPPASGAKVLATVQGAEVTEAEVERAAAGALRPLQDKMRQVLDATLRTLVDNRVLDLESSRQGITREQLVAREVDAKAGVPTEAEVDAWFEQHRAQQAGKSREEAAPQIRQTLAQRRRQEAREALLVRLRTQYQVRNLLAEELAAAEEQAARTRRAELERPGFPAQGSPTSAVKIVLFSDFECPFCSRLEPTLHEIEKSYGDRVQLIFRQFPLPFHAHARLAAAASLCAADQGKFWEMHDLLFADQKKLDRPALDDRAAKLGLDGAAFARCLDQGRHDAEIQSDIAAGGSAGVTGTPTMIVNGHLLAGAVSYDDAARLVERELAAARAGAAARSGGR